MRDTSIRLPSAQVTAATASQLNLLSIDCMDPDIAEALFGDAADVADEDWVLDDDFVAQAAAEPEAPDFDFDAHIAALIERR